MTWQSHRHPAGTSIFAHAFERDVAQCVPVMGLLVVKLSVFVLQSESVGDA